MLFWGVKMEMEETIPKRQKAKLLSNFWVYETVSSVDSPHSFLPVCFILKMEKNPPSG